MIWIYNRIVKNRNYIRFSEKNIDVQLKKRFDALPNIAKTVKKFLTHEQDVHSKIVDLRNKYNETTSREGKVKLEQDLSQVLGGISLSVENYPELKSNESVIHLQRSINEFAEQIAASQRAYNASVLEYNDSISAFPNNIIANVFRFNKEDYMQIVSEEEKKNINIDNLL